MQATIKSKITLGLGFLFLIILLLSGVGAYYLFQLSRSAEATLKDNYRSVAYAQHMSDALSALRDANLAGSPAMAATASTAWKSFEQNLADEQRNITEPGEGQLADSIAANSRQYLLLEPTTADSRARYQQLRHQISRVAGLNLRAIEAQGQRTRQIATRTITVLGLVAALGILATFSFIFSFPDYVTKPVEELTAGIRRLAAGDYSQRLPKPAYTEFTEITQAFNDMAQKLEDYETPAGTPRIDRRGPLDIVTSYQRPGTPPTA